MAVATAKDRVVSLGSQFGPYRRVLADAIAERNALGDELARIEVARRKVGHAWDYEEAIEAAQAALREAKVDEADRFTRELLGEETEPSPLPAALAAVRAAEDARDRVVDVHQRLAQRERDARWRLDFQAKRKVDEAIVAVLRAEVLEAFVSEYDRTAHQMSALLEIAEALPDMVFPPLQGQQEQSLNRQLPDYNFGRQRLRDVFAAWRGALAALVDNPDTKLPPMVPVAPAPEAA